MNQVNLEFDKQLELSREKLLILGDVGRVAFSTVQFFIENCAYWDHPSVGFVNAPKHSERITHGRFGYDIRFGGNYFLVESGISTCVYIINSLLDSFESGEIEYTFDRLVCVLSLIVRGAVANNDGNEYSGYYPVQGDYMMFGTQAINVRDFVGIIVATTQVEKIYKLIH